MSRSKANNKRRFSRYKPVFKVLGYSSALTLVILAGFVSCVWLGFFGKIPSAAEVEGIHHHNASLVYASDGILMGKYYLENRNSIPVETLPPHLLDALIATEDARFFDHGGIDLRSLGRVMYYSVLRGQSEYGGGSTITQQLAKNLYPRRSFGPLTIPVAKAREIIIAKKLERVYDKQEILELYLNTIPFGENVYGVEAASLRFYNKSASRLTVDEAAVLIGLLKANTTYNPRLNPEASISRRNVVLSQMYNYGYLSQGRSDTLKTADLKLDYAFRGRHDGIAPYFRDQVRKECEAILEVLSESDGIERSLYRDGLRVYTTLKPDMQRYAEIAVKEHMTRLQANFGRDSGSRLSNKEEQKAIENSARYRSLKAARVDGQRIDEIFNTKKKMELFSWKKNEVLDLSPLDSIRYVTALMQVGMMAADPNTGQVMAWVGGIDHRHFGYDHVNSRRQAGSTFKPVVFAAALENGQTPCEFISAARESYPEYNDWSPRNAGGHYDGYWSMSGALAKSVNTVAVKVFMETGTEPVVQTAKKMGFSGDLPAYPALALGTAETSLFELTKVYSVFASGGRRGNLHTVSRIEDREGNVLYTAPSMPSVQVIDPRTSEILTSMMQHAVDSGTASSLRTLYKLKGDIAGKTGTTQGHADGWFMGYTPGMVAGVWVGADNPALSFSNLSFGQGAYMALPIWGRFMQQVQKNEKYRSVSMENFNVHPEVKELLDCPSWVEELPEEEDFFELLFRRGRRYERRNQSEPDSWFRELFKKDESTPKPKNKKRKKPRRKRAL